MYQKMKKRKSKFQYEIKAERKNVISKASIFKKINNYLNFNNNFKNKINKIKPTASYIIMVLVLLIFSLFIISLFNDDSKNAIFDFQFFSIIQVLTLIPIFVFESVRNNESHEDKKKRFELCDFILDSILLVIIGYLIVFSEMAEKTNMVKTTLTKSKNILILIVLLLTPIKIYYSTKLFRFSRKENSRK